MGAGGIVMGAFNSYAALETQVVNAHAQTQGRVCEEIIKKSDGKAHCTPEGYKQLVAYKDNSQRLEHGNAQGFGGVFWATLGLGILGYSGKREENENKKNPAPTR
jgi:hypothetical protein